MRASQALQQLAAQGAHVVALTADSRKVEPGVAFAAYPGAASDGRRYVAQAIAAGASAVLWEHEGFGWTDAWRVPHVAVAGLKAQLSAIAHEVYGKPSERLWVVGVTGTNGKTSVSQWIAQAFALAGKRCGVIGTLGAGFPGALRDLGNTTPDAIELQATLRGFVDDCARAASMEVSSIGLDQHRVDGVQFDVAVFTNLTRDHLDYHGTLEAYAAAKRRFFDFAGLDAIVVNADDATGRDILAHHAKGPFVVSYGREQGDLRATDVKLDSSGVRFDIVGAHGRAHVAAPMIGAFNVSNLLAVIGVLLASGIELTRAAQLCAQLQPVPGRLERVHVAGKPLVVVDYAHTPDALENALAALRPNVAGGGALVCVFGCGGDRDPGKRPLMGEIASRLADRVVITSDNPRSEDPDAIVAQVAAGARRQNFATIVERRAAIHHAVATATPQDVILIAGKGAETYQEIRGVKHPFNDMQVAREALAA